MIEHVKKGLSVWKLRRPIVFLYLQSSGSGNQKMHVVYSGLLQLNKTKSMWKKENMYLEIRNVNWKFA